LQYAVKGSKGFQDGFETVHTLEGHSLTGGTNWRFQGEETATDVKWPRRPGRQSEFVAMCMAGARWNLAPLGSREIVRQLKLNPRGRSLRKLGIQGERFWWKLQNENQS
jgi:hypothetical protein